MPDLVAIVLLIASGILLMALRFLFVVERLKKRAEVERRIRKERAPTNTRERAEELRSIMRNRLGIDPKTIPLNSDWRMELRIPAGSLFDFSKILLTPS